jgi:hypothetical protein
MQQRIDAWLNPTLYIKNYASPRYSMKTRNGNCRTIVARNIVARVAHRRAGVTNGVDSACTTLEKVLFDVGGAGGRPRTNSRHLTVVRTIMADGGLWLNLPDAVFSDNAAMRNLTSA